MASIPLFTTEKRGSSSILSLGAGLITYLLKKDYSVNIQDIVAVTVPGQSMAELYTIERTAKLWEQGLSYGLIAIVALIMYVTYRKIHDGRVEVKAGVQKNG